MNFDRRRINGPEESFTPVFLEEDDVAEENWKPGNPRLGRSPLDIRPICESDDEWQKLGIKFYASFTTRANKPS
jgi:hypothetical protein